MKHFIFYPQDDNPFEYRDSRNFLHVDGRIDATRSAGFSLPSSDDVGNDENDNEED